MEKTGLAKRVALRCMLLTGGTFTGMLIGFAIGGIILGLLLASGFARTVIFCAIAAVSYTHLSNLPLERVAKGACPYIFLLILVVFFLIFFPDVVTFLPKALGMY